MKWLLAITCLLSTQLIFSQRLKQNPEEDPSILARQLTANCTTELEKVSIIFKWITDNISYRTIPNNIYRRNGSPKRQRIKEEEEDTSALKPLNERVAQDVLRERMGVCNGYARLFTTLCDYAGLRSEIITGYAKTNANKPRFGANHYWNAVMIDSAWRLLDATWASGYIFRNEFVHEYDAHYFLTSPKTFVLDHFPDDPRWTLLDESPLPGEFYSSPFKQKSFIKYKFTSYYPKTGIIEASVGDTIQLVLETADAQHDKDVAPDLLIDSTIFSHSNSWIFLKPDPDSGNPNKLNYYYTVSSPDIEWLYLVYNDDLVLRYKIKVKKEIARN
jgi:Transglutaminase-like superfamily